MIKSRRGVAEAERGVWVSAQVDHRASATGGEELVGGGAAEEATRAVKVDLTKALTPVPDDLTSDDAVSGDADVPVDEASERAQVVVQDAPTPTPVSQRVDFGAHLEANYQRLVAQLFAITLDAGEAHDAVQDAYSRAWRRWPEVGAGADPTAWVRRVAVRSTQRSWRRILGRLGLSRPGPVGDGDPRTAALLAALGRLPVTERRVVVLHHMVGMSHGEIAALEQTGVGTVRARLGRAHIVVSEGMADELPSVLGLPGDANPYGAEQYGSAYDDDIYDDTHDDRRYDVRYAADERLR